ncbi:MAG: Uma2 family endonuclease [Symploca sp. SIO2C1]|nr:Uma2 family endonuclease [Symploca sp. SIO2C1]
MSVKVKSITEQVEPPRSPKENLPTMYDLPSEDPEEPGLPDEFHLWQAQLCSATFRPPNYPSDRTFVASDLNLYYDPQHPSWYKRPDWFAVVGVSRFYEERELRLSYVTWQEGVRPTVAIEFLSPSTRAEDLGETERQRKPPTKWEVYEQILGIPYYTAVPAVTRYSKNDEEEIYPILTTDSGVPHCSGNRCIVFDRLTNQLQFFQLDGSHYRKRELIEERIWLPDLELGLGLWRGKYRELERPWLRWYDSDGNWILTDAEQEAQRAEQESQRAEQESQRAEQESQRAEQESQRAEQESQRAERLAQRLRQAGIDPNEIE